MYNTQQVKDIYATDTNTLLRSYKTSQSSEERYYISIALIYRDVDPNETPSNEPDDVIDPRD